MFVILWINEKKYYTYNAKCHWTATIETAATFKTYENACRYAESALKDKLNELEYVELDSKKEENDEDKNIPVLTKEEAEQAFEDLRKAAEAFGKAATNIPAIMKYYQDVQSEQDKLQEDLLHKFEFVNSSNIIFIKLGRMLKNCRNKRREAKDRIGYMIALNNSKPKDILKAHMGHDHLIETRTYIPRIAPELFK